ncbi:hypothetical protein F2Q68_00039057 [Brassica cretica]|uniref:TLC domain-containing protein n=1 Tax=Brassica cretica TaxID=69181 RepID=A0A8S9MIY3_BRACR|nr:hypothetical protein F2Q68_00039057 [Brassica cretica]
MEEEQIRVVKIIVIGVILWGVSFILTRRIFSSYSFDFSNRLLSTVHATAAVTLATLSVQDWSCPVCPRASKPSPQQFDQVISMDNAVHHFVSILGFVAGFAYQKNNNNKRATQSFKTSRNQTTSAHKDSGNQRLIPPYKSKINQSTTPLPNFSSIREDLTVGFTKHSRQHC